MAAATTSSSTEPLIFLATCQPHLKQCDGPRHQTTLLTLDEKRAFVDELAARRTGYIPACIDHAGGEQPAADGSGSSSGRFEVGGEHQIGRFVDALLGPKGELLVIGEVWHDRPEAAMIADDIRSGRNDPAKGNRPWGVSLCTNLAMDADLTTVHAKKVTHVGITRDPEFGPEGTHMHLTAANWDAFYRHLKEDFLDKDGAGAAGWYVPPSLQKRIADATAAPRRVNIDVAASRLVPSEIGARLPPRAAPPAAPPAPPASMSSTPPDSAPSTAPSTTPMDVVPQQQQQQQPQQQPLDRQQMQRVHQEMASFFADIQPKDKEQKMDVPYDADRLVRAKSIINAYSKVLSGVPPNQWDGDVFAHLAALNEYIATAQREGDKFIDEQYKSFLSPNELQRYKQAVADPVSASNYPTAVQVFATRGMTLTNQRSMEARLMQVNLETEKQRKEADAEREALKKKREEWEKEREEMQLKIADLTKRQRVEAPSPSAAATASATAAAPLTSVDVGASRTLPAFAVNGRIVSTSAFLEDLTPTDYSQATLNAMRNTKFMTPWRADENSWLKKSLAMNYQKQQ